MTKEQLLEAQLNKKYAYLESAREEGYVVENSFEFLKEFPELFYIDKNVPTTIGSFFAFLDGTIRISVSANFEETFEVLNSKGEVIVNSSSSTYGVTVPVNKNNRYQIRITNNNLASGHISQMKISYVVTAKKNPYLIYEFIS